MMPDIQRSRPLSLSINGSSTKALDSIDPLGRLDAAQRREMAVVAAVLPFRVNRYVLDHLIDWHRVPDDPIFRIVFPRREMLEPTQFDRVATAFQANDATRLACVVADVREELNPIPARQDANIPSLHGRRIPGLQHKYDNTLLVFPAQGQTCHTYCAYCFRWAQFIGDPTHHMAAAGPAAMLEYLDAHPEVTDVLLTGGDPMVMSSRRLGEFLKPLCSPRFEHVASIRIGTRAISFSPARFVDDSDADALLRLVEGVVAAGKQLAIVAHVDHPRELEAPVARRAVRRLQNAGALIRGQGPLLRGVNDDAAVLSSLWAAQVRLGIVPYYLFLARNTGAKRCFEVPIDRALTIFRSALRSVSGLGRAVRGPVMSTGPGKLVIHGDATVGERRAFVLSFIQARRPDWVGRPFLAAHDCNATWLSHLRPLDAEFFFEAEYRSMSGSSEETLS